MYYIFSPTKEMKESTSTIDKSIPFFVDKSEVLMKRLKEYSSEEIASLMNVNDKIAQLNYLRFQNFKYDNNGFICIDTYSGLQFKQLSFSSYTNEQLTFMNNHIRIISGLYGILNPFDSIYPYRLEMACTGMELLAYWDKDLCNYFNGELLIDVASKEYSSVFKNYSNIIHIAFKIEKDNKYIMQSTQVKIQRGKFLDYIIKNKIDSLEGIRAYHEEGYLYREDLSNEHNYVFVRR